METKDPQIVQNVLLDLSAPNLSKYMLDKYFVYKMLQLKHIYWTYTIYYFVIDIYYFVSYTIYS